MSDAINPAVPIVARPEMVKAIPLTTRQTDVMVYMMNGCRIIVSRDNGAWHLSISRANRLPTYGELVTARYRLLPFVEEMAMFFPPMSEFVNLHPYTLHLFQTR